MALEQPSAVVAPEDIRPGLNETGSEIPTRRFVKREAGGTVDSVVLCGAGERALGVTMQSIVNGDRGNVQIGNMAIVTAAAAIGTGALVASDATGKAVAAANPNIAMGITRSAALNADEAIEVELFQLGGNVVP